MTLMKYVAYNIGFDDSIPPDFYTPHGFSTMINKHCQHPSIVKIRENISNELVFDFQCVNAHDISNIIKSFDGKKAHGYDMVPMKLLQKSAQHIVPDIARLINNSLMESIFLVIWNSLRPRPFSKRKTTWIKLIIDPWVFSSLNLKYMKRPSVYN